MNAGQSKHLQQVSHRNNNDAVNTNNNVNTYKTTTDAIYFFSNQFLFGFVSFSTVPEMCTRKINAGLCMLWQLFQLSSCSIAHMKYSNLKAINWGLPLAGHKLNVTPIATSKVTNHIKCMAECGKNKQCVSINLGPSQGGVRE